jgi:hypothetical protein
MPRAGRLAKVDAEGVMRWADGGGEVALFGVNYYPPFTVDYKAIKEQGLDFSQVMREDVAHFRRLGLTCIRIHCFDRQFSTHEGAFVANHHVALLDELIDLCAKNGIYTVLTPIAWWGGSYADDKAGQQIACDANSFRTLFRETGPGRTAVFRARATDAFTKRVEIVFMQSDGGNWGVDLPLAPEWRTVRVPVEDFRPYWHTRRGDGTKPDMSQVQSVSLGFGRWLYHDTLDRPHGFEISSIKVEF